MEMEYLEQDWQDWVPSGYQEWVPRGYGLGTQVKWVLRGMEGYQGVTKWVQGVGTEGVRCGYQGKVGTEGV